MPKSLPLLLCTMILDAKNSGKWVKGIFSTNPNYTKIKGFFLNLQIYSCTDNHKKIKYFKLKLLLILVEFASL